MGSTVSTSKCFSCWTSSGVLQLFNKFRPYQTLSSFPKPCTKQISRTSISVLDYSPAPTSRVVAAKPSFPRPQQISERSGAQSKRTQTTERHHTRTTPSLLQSDSRPQSHRLGHGTPHNWSHVQHDCCIRTQKIILIWHEVPRQRSKKWLQPPKAVTACATTSLWNKFARKWSKPWSLRPPVSSCHFLKAHLIPTSFHRSQGQDVSLPSHHFPACRLEQVLREWKALRIMIQLAENGWFGLVVWRW